jgi:hypothetical protein
VCKLCVCTGIGGAECAPYLVAAVVMGLTYLPAGGVVPQARSRVRLLTAVATRWVGPQTLISIICFASKIKSKIPLSAFLCANLRGLCVKNATAPTAAPNRQSKTKVGALGQPRPTQGRRSEGGANESSRTMERKSSLSSVRSFLAGRLPLHMFACFACLAVSTRCRSYVRRLILDRSRREVSLITSAATGFV